MFHICQESRSSQHFYNRVSLQFMIISAVRFIRILKYEYRDTKLMRKKFHCEISQLPIAFVKG